MHYASFPFFFNIINATRQIKTDKADPAGAAIPIGSKLSGKYRDARYAPGTRTKVIASILCINPM